MFKLFGFNDNEIDCEELTQVTIEFSDPDDLRALADFLIRSADEAAADGDWEHEHLHDYVERELKSDIVLFRR